MKLKTHILTAALLCRMFALAFIAGMASQAGSFERLVEVAREFYGV